MSVFIYSHPDIFLHDQEAGHQAMEADRIKRVYERLIQVEGVELKEAPLASQSDFLLNHTPEMVERIFTRAPTRAGEFYSLDNETRMNRHTLGALRRSTGAALSGLDDLLSGRSRAVFCATYAGHHATPSKSQGFCFFNPVAIAAAAALTRGISRVAILDFDTHSGNGTILSFLHDPRVFFAETYQPGYPGSFLPGFCPAHIHRSKARGAIDFWAGWSRHFQALDAFDPELIILSAGFDAHASDPLGSIRLADADYSRFATEVMARKTPVLACLEGGYNVEATARCSALFIEGLSKENGAV